MNAPPSLADDARAVGIWIRVSHEDSVLKESPEHHEYRARAYAEAKGWRVVEVYRLDAVSGKSVRHLPDAERMVADVRSGKITGLIFSKLARLARNTRELLDFADLFRECGADLISLQESIDTSTPAGRLFYTMIAALGQWEREETAERVAASVPIRARLGKPLGGAAPFGYRWHEGALVPDSEEAPVRRLIYELFALHKRRKTVARLLNDAGHRTRGGSKFSDTTVTRLLEDTTAKGLRRANYTKSTGDGKKWVMKPESEWVLVPVDAVVSEELWEECNAVLKSQQQPRARVGRRPLHLFTGVVFCACGSKMYVPSNSPKYTCYSCRRKIPMMDLETVFREQLRGFFVSEGEVEAYLSRASGQSGEKEDILVALEREQRTLGGEMEKVYRLYLAGELTESGFGRLYRPLEERFDQIETERPRLQGEIDYLRIQAGARAAILEEAHGFFDRWPSFTSEEKRRVIEAMVSRITVSADEIEIDMHFGGLPSDSSEAAERQHGLMGSWPRRASRAPETRRTAAPAQ